MNCLICFKPFVKEKEFENYNRNPELCKNALFKLFRISNDPDVQGLFEDMDVCRGCHQYLEKLRELMCIEEHQGSVHQVRILIKQMLDTSKEASRPPIGTSRCLDMSKTNLDRIILLKAIEARNTPPPPPATAMDLQEEDDNAIGENFQKQIPPKSKLTTVSQMGEKIESEHFIDESSLPNNPTNSSVGSITNIEAKKDLVNSPNNSNRGEASTILLDENPEFTREFVISQFIEIENGSFQCSQCFKILKRNSLKGHLLIHGPPKFKCTWIGCGKMYYHRRNLNVHISSVHERKRDFKCSIKGCGKDFSRKWHLDIHVKRVHEGRKDFKCPVEGCDKSWISRSDLNRHISKFHNKSKIQVPNISAPDSEPIPDQQVEVESVEGRMVPSNDGMWYAENAKKDGQEETHEYTIYVYV